MNDSLRDWIRAEMTLEKRDVLLQVRDRVAPLVGVSPDGAVGFRLSGEDMGCLGAQEKILLYMIGKLFSQAAGYSDSDAVSNTELQDNLGMPEGTVRGQLTRLRGGGLVNAERVGSHSIARNRVLEALDMVERKLRR